MDLYLLCLHFRGGQGPAGCAYCEGLGFRIQTRLWFLVPWRGGYLGYRRYIGIDGDL